MFICTCEYVYVHLNIHVLTRIRTPTYTYSHVLTRTQARAHTHANVTSALLFSVSVHSYYFQDMFTDYLVIHNESKQELTLLTGDNKTVKLKPQRNSDKQDGA